MRALALLLAILGNPVPLWSLDPDRQLGQYVFDNWQPRQGLPHPFVRALAQTSDGYVWLGTAVGLVRFDGVRFTLFDSSTTKEITHHHILSLAATRDGSLWIGTYGGGVVQYQNGRFHSHAARIGGHVWAMHASPDGSVLMAGASGLWSYRDGAWTGHTDDSGSNVSALSNLPDGTILAGTHGSGLRRSAGGQLIAVPSLDSQNIRAVLQDRAGTLWTGLEGGGVLALQNGKLQIPPALKFLQFDTVHALLEDADGNLWIGSDTHGLVRYRSGTVSRLAPADLSSGNSSIWALMEDREGNVWTGMRSGGLGRLTNGKFISYSAREGLPHNDIWSVYEDSSNAIWLGTAGGGLAVLRNGTISNYSRSDGLPDNYIRAIFEDSHGSLWVGTNNGGVARRRGERFETVSTSASQNHSGIRAIAETPDGSIWIGTGGEGLQRHLAGRVTTLLRKDGLPGNSISALHTDRAGRLWAGFFGRGLAVIHDGTIKLYGVAEGLTYPTVWSFSEDSGGGLWMATNGGGIFRFRDGRFSRYTTANGLPSDVVSRVVEDSQGALWLACDRGVFRAIRSEFDNIDKGSSHQIRGVTYDTSDGLKSIECSGGNQFPAYRAHDGQVWFATTRGLSVVAPALLRTNPLPPSVLIESVSTNGGPRMEHTGTVPLQAGARNLEIQYTGLSMQAPEKVRFQYKLEGFDREWINAGPRRVAYYAQLPPGNYTFRLKAANSDALENTANTTLDFHQVPFFYQTPWFALLCFAGVLLTGWWIHWTRLQRAQRGFAALLEERTRIAREMHDTVIQGCIGAGTLLEAASSVLPLSKDQAAGLIDQARAQFRKCVDEARFYVWNLRSPEGERVDLRRSLTLVAEEASARHGNKVSLNIAASFSGITFQQAHHLTRIAQEAIANSARHSGSQVISVRLDECTEGMRLSIRDRGRGFVSDPTRPGDSHFGLIGMRERARQIGGVLTIATAEGSGTEVTVTLAGVRS